MAQNLVRRLQLFSLRNSATASAASTSANAEPEIQIPIRIERSPTDILSALEKTIKRDPTATHYKYHDDPFLIPTSNITKRTFALSKESGRKAAMWILKEYSELFQHKLAEPAIPAFSPKAVYTNKDEVSEELLMNVIKQGAVTDAVTIYELMKDDTSVEAKQALLELLCFYNSTEQLPETLTEERWFRRAVKGQRQIWKQSPEAEEIFNFLKDQEKPIAAAAYNTYICGTAKYMKIERAWSLFEECENKGIPMNVTTYNLVIQMVSLLRDGVEERKALLMEMLEKMEKAGVRPNLGTLNACLRVASVINNRQIAKDLVRSLFTEFRRLGIEPSLASYYYALITFCQDRGPKSALLSEIIDYIQGKSFTMQDPSDTYFFVTAMDVARNHLHDSVVAEKLHKLLFTGDNYNFIGEGFKESIYYRHYMCLMLETLPFVEFMAFYDLLVPHIYIPEPSVMESIVEATELAEPSVIHDVLPRLWSHMTMFDQLDRESLVTKAMNIMRMNCPVKGDAPVNQLFADAAWGLWTFVTEQNERRHQPITWSGKVLADIALLCLRGGEFERFLHVLEYMKTQQSSIIGTADIEQLNEMFMACLERGHSTGALDVVQYCAEAGFEEAGTMGRKVVGTVPLTANEEIQLANLVGSEVLKTESSNDD